MYRPSGMMQMKSIEIENRENRCELPCSILEWDLSGEDSRGPEDYDQTFFTNLGIKLFQSVFPGNTVSL